MSTTYKVVGGDGNEYGPITLDQLKQWVREGRLNSETHVAKDGDTAWRKASDFPELGVGAAIAPAPMTTARPSTGESFNHPQADLLLARVKSSASWFWWIAALTLINSIMAMSGSNGSFAAGLGICQIFDGLGAGGGRAVSVILDLIAIGFVVLIGWFATKAKPWAFLLALVLFGLDTLIFVFSSAYLGIIIHALALYSFWNGFAASRRLRSGA